MLFTSPLVCVTYIFPVMLLLFIVIFSVVSPDPEAALSIILSIVLFSIM